MSTEQRCTVDPDLPGILILPPRISREAAARWAGYDSEYERGYHDAARNFAEERERFVQREMQAHRRLVRLIYFTAAGWFTVAVFIVLWIAR